MAALALGRLEQRVQAMEKVCPAYSEFVDHSAVHFGNSRNLAVISELPWIGPY